MAWLRLASAIHYKQPLSRLSLAWICHYRYSAISRLEHRGKALVAAEAVGDVECQLQRLLPVQPATHDTKRMIQDNWGYFQGTKKMPSQLLPIGMESHPPPKKKNAVYCHLSWNPPFHVEYFTSFQQQSTVRPFLHTRTIGRAEEGCNCGRQGNRTQLNARPPPNTAT